MNAISKMMRPASVAVIGASADAAKTSGRPVAYLRKHGFAGDIYPVNPRYDSIDGLPCYPDVASLPHTPDVGIVLLGAERAHVAVRDLASRGTSAAIVLASGYAEIGEEGAERQAQLIEAAGSMRLLGPNTIGLVNLTDRITLSASGALETDSFTIGVIGVVSQSGGFLARCCRGRQRAVLACQSWCRRAMKQISTWRTLSIIWLTMIRLPLSRSTWRGYVIRTGFAARH